MARSSASLPHRPSLEEICEKMAEIEAHRFSSLMRLLRRDLPYMNLGELDAVDEQDIVEDLAKRFSDSFFQRFLLEMQKSRAGPVSSSVKCRAQVCHKTGNDFFRS